MQTRNPAFMPGLYEVEGQPFAYVVLGYPTVLDEDGDPEPNTDWLLVRAVGDDRVVQVEFDTVQPLGEDVCSCGSLDCTATLG